jgi:hypothetical protein
MAHVGANYGVQGTTQVGQTGGVGQQKDAGTVANADFKPHPLDDLGHGLQRVGSDIADGAKMGWAGGQFIARAGAEKAGLPNFVGEAAGAVVGGVGGVLGGAVGLLTSPLDGTGA